MKKNVTTSFEKLNEKNFKTVNNKNITGGEFHFPKTWRRESVRTHRHLAFDHEFKMVED